MAHTSCSNQLKVQFRRCTADSVATALGGDVIGTNRVLAPGPAHSPKDRSLVVTLTSDDFLVHSFAGDDWRTCRDHVRARLGLPHRTMTPRHRRWVQTPMFDPVGRPDNRSAALTIWHRAIDPRGTLAERYLATRGLALDDDLAGRALRFSASEPLNGERHPAMVALYRHIRTNEPHAIQRTWLTSDGRKIERRMLGPVKGCAVKLDGDEDVALGLHLAEGVETALAARLVGFRPVWGVGSAGAIKSFPVLAGIDAITICGETDDNGANARAAQECAARWIEAGREAFVIEPLMSGDLNDVWKAVAQ